MRTQLKAAHVLMMISSLVPLTGCDGSTTLVSTPGDGSTATASTESSQVKGDDKISSNESLERAIGDRARPAPIGSTALIKDASGSSLWEVSLLESNLNVNEVVANENQFNSPPPPGYQFAMAKIRVTYLGTGNSMPSASLTIAFVSASGTTHKEHDVVVVGPNELSNVNELYTGGTATANSYILIPTADSARGTWRVSSFFTDGEFHFASN